MALLSPGLTRSYPRGIRCHDEIWTRRARTASDEPPNLLTSGVGTSTHTRASDEVVLIGVRGGRGASGNAQLREDVAHVPVDRPIAEHELGGDRPVRRASGDEAQHLQPPPRGSMSKGCLGS